MMPLLAACGGDHLGSLNLEYSGPISGKLVASAGEVSGTSSGDLAHWPPTEDVGLNDDQLFLSVPRLSMGTLTTARAELTAGGQRYTTNAGGAVEVTTERIRWNSGRFPFLHEGTFAGTIEGVEVEGRFTVSEDNCHNTILNIDNTGCGGPWLWSESDKVEVDVSTWLFDSCPQEIRDLYVDGDTLAMNRKTARFGGAQPLSCFDTRPAGGKSTQGDVRFEGGPYQCGDDTSITIDGCNWNIIAHSSPQRWFALSAAIVDDSCEELTCTMLAGEVMVRPL